MESELKEAVKELSEIGGNVETPLNKNNTKFGDLRRKGELTRKEFVMRNSLLTDLFEMYNIRAIYNIFLAILILLILNSLIEDVFEEGMPDLSFSVIRWCFGYLPLVILTWAAMWLSTVVIAYPAFHFWANSTTTGTLVNGVFVLLYFLYLTAFFFFPMLVLAHFPLPIASACIITCEQVHGFIRENIPRALAWKRAQTHRQNSEDREETVPERPCPTFQRFVFFHFIPTLIYRDSYPRQDPFASQRSGSRTRPDKQEP